MKRRLALSSVILLSVPFGERAEEPRALSQPGPPQTRSQAAPVRAIPPVIILQADRLKGPATDGLGLAPGLYTAAPYTALVYVPPPLDPKVIVNPGRGSLPRARIIEPELRLIPRR